MKKFIITIAAAIGLIGLGQSAQPVFAAEESNPIESTFAITENETNDLASIKFGRNLLVAGNNVIDESTVKGLLFSFGNQLSLGTRSDYTFVAGNIIDFTGETERDLFIAGNAITLSESSKIGRDTFIAGNTVSVNADLSGDFSAAAAKVVFNNIKIDGNVNLDVAEVAFTGKVEIAGSLILNSDAVVSGLGNAKYASLEKYENLEYEPTATEVLVGKILSILGLFITMVIILALFARTDEKIDHEMSALQFGKDLVVGFCALVFIPIISIFLLISIIAAPAGIVLLVTYLIMLYLAQGFTGLWIGKLIIKKLLRSKGNRFLEALLGIIILVFAGMIPGFGWTISFTAEVLGLGLILQSINPSRKRIACAQSSQSTAADGITEAEVVKSQTESSTKKAAKASDEDTTNTSTKTSDEKATNPSAKTSPKGSQAKKSSVTDQKED